MPLERESATATPNAGPAWASQAVRAILVGLLAVGVVGPSPEAGAKDGPRADVPNGRIVFASDRKGDFDLYVKDLAGGPAWRLTSNDKDESEPAWSPDGTRVVFVREMGRFSRSGELFVKTIGRGRAKRLLSDTTVSDERDPAWSPDGDWISFSSAAGIDGASTYAFNVRTRKLVPIATERENSVVGEGAWSPGGNEFVYSESYEGSELYVQSFPGYGTARELVSQGTLYAHNLDWSPDGSKLLFARGNDSDWDLFVYDFASDSQAPLREEDADQTLDPIGAAENARDLPGSWSPDGGFITYYSDEEGSFGVYLLELATGKSVRFTRSGGDDVDPDWAP